jgi:uroporphyrinogen decarboxylase
MNSRERILAAIDHQPVDRVPTDIWATEEVWQSLESRFGSRRAIFTELHIDGFAATLPRYVGPPLPQVAEHESVDYWGIRRRATKYRAGTYDEMYFHPLAEARSAEDLERFPWPRADWFDTSEMRAELSRARESQAVMVGYMTPFFLHNKLRGLEQSLVDPLLYPQFTHDLVQRITDAQLDIHRRIFESCDGLIDVAQVTDDYGSQTGPLISLDCFRKFYKPHVQRCIDLCSQFGIKVFHHDDGSVREFLPDLIEMGIHVLNPIQWRCPGMDMEELKAEFGGAVCFHGAVDNQQVLPSGSPEEVRAEVRRCIEQLAADGTGYILAPCHNIQPITPMENILAMYDEAYHYGREAARG